MVDVCVWMYLWTQYLQLLEQLLTIFRAVGLHQVDPVLHEEVLLRYGLLLEGKAELSVQDFARKIAGGSTFDLDWLQLSLFDTCLSDLTSCRHPYLMDM